MLVFICSSTCTSPAFESFLLVLIYVPNPTPNSKDSVTAKAYVQAKLMDILYPEVVS